MTDTAKDTVKVRVSARTNKVGSECVDEVEFDRAVWESMSDEEKDEECMSIAFNSIEWGWEEV